MFIPNPVEIQFDPFTVDDEKNAKEDGVHIRDIFEDPIQRTLWLAYKSTHITDQYFRHAVVVSSNCIRQSPPRLAECIQIYNLGGGMAFMHNWRPFQDLIFPFIIWNLMQENLWRFFVPPGVVPCELKYVIEMDAKVRAFCTQCQQYFMKRKSQSAMRFCTPACQDAFEHAQARAKRLTVTPARTRMIAFPSDFD